jgi:hypothetical protein
MNPILYSTGGIMPRNKPNKTCGTSIKFNEIGETIFYLLILGETLKYLQLL